MNASESALQTLEFPALREMAARHCTTPAGRLLAEALAPFAETSAADDAQEETAESARFLEESGRIALRLPDDPTETIHRLRIEGILLMPPEILSVVRLSSATVSARRALARQGDRWPRLAARASNLPDLEGIVTLIEPHIIPLGLAGRAAPDDSDARSPDGGGVEGRTGGMEGASRWIADSASQELRRLRRRAEQIAAKTREILEGMLRRSGADQYLSDQFVTERGGRYVLPVRTDSPSAPRGIVHGSSSSGATIFVEPMETLDLNNELVQVRDKEAAEVERILVWWTSRLAERHEDLARASEELGRIDFALARGELARAQRAVRPRLGAAAGLSIVEARHPILEEVFAAAARSREGRAGREARAGRAGRTGSPGEAPKPGFSEAQGVPDSSDSPRSVVPLTVTLMPEESTLVISGPNTGGKTVALKTVGLLSLMAYSGLHVPAGEFQLPELSRVLVDIGDHQSIEASLSTFSAHIANIAGMIRELDDAPHAERALVLLDEIGTGTDPDEGSALATALLEHLMGAGALTIVTTHHGAVKAWAYATPGVGNAAVDFDEENLRPTYRLRMGVAGASSGLSIAARLGLDERVIAAARGRISSDAREAESLLSRLRGMLASAEQDAGEAARLRADLDRERREFESSSRVAEEKRTREFTQSAGMALDAFRRKSTDLIARVADRKEKIRLERERLSQERELKDTVAAEMKRMGIGAAKGAAKEAVRTGHPIQTGDRVVVSPFGRTGIVQETDGETALVLIGSTRTRSRLRDLQLADGDRAGDIVPSRVTIADETDIPGELMLIGSTVDDGMILLDKFLDDAFLAGRREVRIVHGHGSGRLRTAVSKFLARHPQVDSQRLGHPSEGGTGATIATLRV